MASKKKSRLSKATSDYLGRTHRPLNCLMFILPLLVAYEVGSIFYSDCLLAPRHLTIVLNSLGAAARFLPAALIVVVLLAWHVASRQKRHIDADAVAGMFAESVVGMVPLVALALLTDRLIAPEALAAGAGGQALAAEILTGIGAGIYEEFIFRLAAIGLIMLVFVDLLKAARKPTAVLAVVAASVLFSLYHFIGPASFDWRLFVFRGIAGAYLAILSIGRGFGVAVGAHACYNVVVALM
ncbi:MAG: CPBP family intramembrane metalloprotease [Phycisphaerae bacterium]|nr:CPBP family intramembrane metalloprotease [Phycisphaerae bacterium]